MSRVRVRPMHRFRHRVKVVVRVRAMVRVRLRALHRFTDRVSFWVGARGFG